ncbi:MAG: hypothetical protein V4717_01985 [Bacteroidota bacterium]
MKFLYCLLFFLTLISESYSQKEEFQPDMSRALFHSKLDKAQQQLLAMDGRRDNQITADTDDEVNMQLTYQATTRLDNIQKEIEYNKDLSSNQKIGYIRGLNELLLNYTSELSKRNISWSQLPSLVSAFDEALKLTYKQESLLPAVRMHSYNVGSMIVKNLAFENNPGKKQVKEFLLLKYLSEKPNNILKELAKDVDYSFTDSLVKVTARRMPEELFTYAQARRTVLGQRIRAVAAKDTLVKMVVDLSSLNSGQMYFPFLDQMNSGAVSMDAVAKALKDSTNYYSLLVKTQVAYAARLAKGDTPVAMKGLEVMLRQKSSELFVTTINGLHDSPAAIRFRSIQKLSPEELYYLVVMNETTIYTSSYMYVYNRIFETMPVKSSDSVLARVNYDHYKKFLTMASNYNTLDDFLSRMSSQSSTALMTDFVNNLEKGKNADDIEDAVDVANAYASIKQPAIRQLMLNRVSENLNNAIASDNKKAIVVYHIEKLIMASNDSATSGAINLTDSLGIPPVYEVKNNYLRDSAGRIILQMFFYGDASGKGSFNTLMNLYSDRKKWALKSTADWVQFTSINTPVPFILFANRALDEEKDLDEQAQRNLIKYLEDSNLRPSLTVHRGHSYYLKYTIQKLLPTSKVVVLGSCGAYQNLSDILKVSPDAYIISSKQVGYGEINIALFSYLIENLKVGKDIQWPTMMETVAKGISSAKQEGYDDYVFPHRNLGALFIKAFKIAAEQKESTTGLSKL